MTAEGNNMVMPVSPMYGGYGNSGGFGGWGSDIWIIILVLFAFGGFGGFGGWGGMGMMGGFGGYDFPWILASNANNQNATQGGFNQLATNNAISALQNSVTSGFGDVNLGIAGVNQNICQTGNSIVNAVNGGFSAAEASNNARQIANMQQTFGLQTAMSQGFNSLQAQQAQCCCDNRLAVANLGSDIAREACADRQAVNEGVRDILASNNAGIQKILDKLCDQELQAERRDNANLRSELMYARGQASQIDQTAAIKAGQLAAVNSLVNELRSCPIPAQPVYGSQPIFTCPQSYNSNMGCGCGCNNGF